MSSLALMRWLEASPKRYDAGMHLVTLGRVRALHDAIAAASVLKAGDRVLEIGCGTGAVTERLVERGAQVTALDQNAEMLEQAQKRLASIDRLAGSGGVEWIERTASEVDAFEAASFDAAVLSLCLSEMSQGERRFVLRAAARSVHPAGRVVVADEVRPKRAWQRILQRVGRGPQWLFAWLLAGSVSRPVEDLEQELEQAGLRIEHEERWLFGTLALYQSSAARPDPEA